MGEPVTDTPFAKKFGHLRGADVKTVSETLKAFNKQFNKPIIPQYRNVINDLLQSTHLTVVDARFEYDPIFGFGMKHVFNKFTGAYPDPAAREAIWKAMVTSLDLDVERVDADYKKVSEWSEGKTEADYVKAFGGEGSDEFSQVFQHVKTNEFFLYNRLWGAAIFALIEKSNAELAEETVENWFKAIGLRTVKPKVDATLYIQNLERIAQAEQLFKEIEIREKKKMAERLEEKAKRALEAAKKAEDEEKYGEEPWGKDAVSNREKEVA